MKKPLESWMIVGQPQKKGRYHSILLVVLIGIILSTGCMFRDLRKEIEESKISHGMKGQIEGMAQAQGDVFVLLFEKSDKVLQLQQITLPDDAGNFSFIVTAGTYLLTCFEDRNGNRRHDPGEPAGAWGEPNPIFVAEGPRTVERNTSLTGLVLTMRPGPFPLEGDIAVEDRLELMAPSMFKYGQLADWDDPVFDEEHGSTGFWKPVTFLKQLGAGIYFMEPYDSKKIPILFVHGAVGTPRGWQTLAESLDNRYFQPWVFYYPSGFQLMPVSIALNEIVKKLQNQYGFDRMGVVAHSMGGLVSRGFILNHLVEDGLGTVRVFVSISTPWGGVDMAAKGVEHAPEAIPSWHDVAPQSGYIKRVFDDSLHPKVPHFLLFSYRGDCSLFMENNDGTVEVSSQLDIRAQKDAASVWGLDEDHMSILISKNTMEYLNQALSQELLQ